jgi:hypothetical protein
VKLQTDGVQGFQYALRRVPKAHKNKVSTIFRKIPKYIRRPIQLSDLSDHPVRWPHSHTCTVGPVCIYVAYMFIHVCKTRCTVLLQIFLCVHRNHFASVTTVCKITEFSFSRTQSRGFASGATLKNNIFNETTFCTCFTPLST